MNRKMICLAALIVMSAPAFLTMASAHTTPDATGPPGSGRVNCSPGVTCPGPATPATLAQACEMFDHSPREYTGTGTPTAGNPYFASSSAGTMEAFDGNLLLDCSEPDYALHGAETGNFDGDLEAGIAGVQFHTGGDANNCNWKPIDYAIRSNSQGGNVITVGDRSGLPVVFTVGVNGNPPSTTTPDPTDLTPDTDHGNICGPRDDSVTPASDCTDYLSGEYMDQTHNVFMGSNLYGRPGDGTHKPESFGGPGTPPVGSLEDTILNELAFVRSRVVLSQTIVDLATTGLHTADTGEDTVEGILGDDGPGVLPAGVDGTPVVKTIDGTLDALLWPNDTAESGDNNDQASGAVCLTPNGGGGVEITGSMDPVNGNVIVWIDALLSYDTTGGLVPSAPTIGHACIGTSFTGWQGNTLYLAGNAGHADAVACANSDL